MDEHPFPDAVIADWKFLDAPAPRSLCPKCQKSRRYYCYTCYVPVPHLSSRLPYVKLPVKVDIIKHPSEIDGKSTSPHAAVLARDDVTIHTYPCIPDYDTEKVVLVFPCEQSVTLEELAAKCTQKQSAEWLTEKENLSSNTSQPEPLCAEPVALCEKSEPSSLKEQHTSNSELSCQEENDSVQKDTDIGNITESQNNLSSHTDSLTDGKRKLADDKSDASSQHSNEPLSKQRRVLPSLPFDRVVFIDSTWNQTRNIVGDERLKNLKKVELRSRNTHFWRCQEGIPKFYLSTIEAIYYFMKDLHTLFLEPEYKHEYDNLLFFFAYMYNKIRNSSNGGKGIKAYQR